MLALLALAKVAGSRDDPKPAAELWTQSVSDPTTIGDVRGGLVLTSEQARNAPGFAPDPSSSSHLELALRNSSTGTVIRKIAPQGWDSFRSAHKTVSCYYVDRLFRIVDHGSLVLGVQCPWLAVFDLRTGSVIRRELPDADLLDLNVPARTTPYPLKHVALGVNRSLERVAAAYNVGSSPRIFIYTSDLKTKLHSWPLGRYVQDIAWSRDGKYIVILYSGQYDAARQFIGWGQSRMMLTIPNVEVIDPETGAVIKKLFSGNSREGQVLFSPDGSLTYTIAANRLSDTETQQGGIHIIDWKAAVLTRREFPLHGEFAISEDGRWIAANASTSLKHFALIEPDPFGDDSRFVVLDTVTGQVVLQRSKKTSIARDPALTFADNATVLFTVSGPGRSRHGRVEQKDCLTAYCLGATCTGR